MEQNKNVNGAIAVFVKTPGLSPIKTRLAESIGKEAAEKFHLLAAKSIESVLENVKVQYLDSNRYGLSPSGLNLSSLNLSRLNLYWAVAEKEGTSHPAWARWNQIWQGEGNLGEKLAHVYSKLIASHPFVLFVGADSPFLFTNHIQQAIESLAQFPFVLGPAFDGGFYLFGGKIPLSKESWLAVEYSATTTMEMLKKELEILGQVAILPPVGDVDTYLDLKEMILFQHENRDRDTEFLTKEQKDLISWAKQVVNLKEKYPKETSKKFR